MITMIFVFTVNALAHEYWFEAEKFTLAPNEKTAVHLYVGDGIVKDREERAFKPDKTLKF